MSVLVAFSVAPAGAESVGDVVAEVVRVVRDSGLPNETNAMHTLVESRSDSFDAQWDEVMAVVKQAVEVCGRSGARVSLVLKADVREGVTDALTRKVARVEQRLQQGAGQ